MEFKLEQVDDDQEFVQQRSGQISQVHRLMHDLNSVVKDISVTTATQGESLTKVASNSIDTFDNIECKHRVHQDSSEKQEQTHVVRIAGKEVCVCSWSYNFAFSLYYFIHLNILSK